ncbi:hypothetical protein GBA52_025093 [Prunus armeniaca]|nr:hypothetical protein GBA52_025093 [Prunus armeniaca]
MEKKIKAHKFRSPSNSSAAEQQGVVCQKPENFNKDVEEVISLGFNPTTLAFVNGLQVISKMTKSTWEHKKEVYRRWGWTEDEILLAFRKKPTCMYLSEKNIVSKMDFLVNKMGWQPADLAGVPGVLTLGLDSRAENHSKVFCH